MGGPRWMNELVFSFKDPKDSSTTYEFARGKLVVRDLDAAMKAGRSDNDWARPFGANISGVRDLFYVYDVFETLKFKKIVEGQKSHPIHRPQSSGVSPGLQALLYGGRAGGAGAAPAPAPNGSTSFRRNTKRKTRKTRR
jgi:hypothetical protein